MLIKNVIFDPDKKRSKSESLDRQKFFCRELLKLEANILFAKYAAGSVSNGLPK